MNFSNFATCEHLQVFLTVEHILRICTKYERSRKQYDPNFQLSRVLLYSPKCNIFN